MKNIEFPESARGEHMVFKRANRSRDDDIVKRILVCGHSYQTDHAGKAIRVPSDSELKAEYQRLRDELVAHFASDHSGERAWAFWQYEQLPAEPLWRWPLTVMGAEGGVSFRWNRAKPPSWQQYFFLKDHDLLQPGEAERCTHLEQFRSTYDIILAQRNT
jgi:hypothetical protein